MDKNTKVSDKPVKIPPDTDFNEKNKSDEECNQPPNQEPSKGKESTKPHPTSKIGDKGKPKQTFKELIKIEKQLKEVVAGDIIQRSAIIERNGKAIITECTINTVQGKFGSHKSRFAAGFAIVLLITDLFRGWLSFKKNIQKEYTVVFVDTERNRTDEFPRAIQDIIQKSGYKKTDSILNFRYTSLKDIHRKDRLKILGNYLNSIRKEHINHLFIILDVVTDCVSSFNKEEEALQLFDDLGNMCENHNATFLLVIHENYGSDKARGHVGTEAMNKSSCVMQIGFEKNGDNLHTDLLRLHFKKLRGARKPEDIFLRYSENEKGLIEAEPHFVKEVVGSKLKAPIDEVMLFIGQQLVEGKEIAGDKFLELLLEEFKCSMNTIKDRVNKITHQEIQFKNGTKTNCVKLVKKSRNGRKTTYELKFICKVKSSNEA